jgi:hypothetical protein
MRGVWNAAIAIVCSATSACAAPTRTLKGDLSWSVQATAGAPSARGAIHVGLDDGGWGGGVDLNAGAVSSATRTLVVRTDVNLAVSTTR